MVNKLKTLIPPLPGVPRGVSELSLNTGVPHIDRIPQLRGIPGFEEFFGMDFEAGIPNFENLEMPRITENKLWPPFYDLACNSSKCTEVGSKKYYSLKVKFEIEKFDEEGIAVFSNFDIERESSLYPKIKYTLKTAPKLFCPQSI